jgi:hypothetical protein
LNTSLDKALGKYVNWRLPVVLSSTSLFLLLMGFGFWYQDRQYSIPTVRPAGLHQPMPGELVPLSNTGLAFDTTRPLFLHFFNPDCPCSRFNLDHLRQLVRRNSNAVRFIAVLEGAGEPARLMEAFGKLNLPIESVVDDEGKWGEVTGVYATPQAVLIGPDRRLYFRGNYNLSRYCAAPETEFARIALESLLAGRPSQLEDPAAATSFGCPRSIFAASRGNRS